MNNFLYSNDIYKTLTTEFGFRFKYTAPITWNGLQEVTAFLTEYFNILNKIYTLQQLLFMF